MGSGRTELLEAIFGLGTLDGGEIHLHGRRVRISGPQEALAHGMAFVGEDRKRKGLVLGMSVKHNLTLSTLQRCCRGAWIDGAMENQLVDGQIETLDIKANHRDQPAVFLSGGNQQKLVLGKALLSNPGMLLLDEPTRGIDVTAKAEIHALIARLAGEGKSILLVSSELPELLSLSHRIMVMRSGTLVAELDPRTTTLETLMASTVPQ
jgi:ABC-type sugar transport system ATPase subunit